MGLMNRAARMAARQGRPAITEDDIYAAMENKAMEAFQVRTAWGLRVIVCMGVGWRPFLTAARLRGIACLHRPAL